MGGGGDYTVTLLVGITLHISDHHALKTNVNSKRGLIAFKQRSVNKFGLLYSLFYEIIIASKPYFFPLFVILM